MFSDSKLSFGQTVRLQKTAVACRLGAVPLVFMFLAALAVPDVPAAGAPAGDGTRYRAVALRSISPEQAIAFVEEAGLECTVSRLPSSNTLLLTAASLELARAGTLLNLVDRPVPYAIREMPIPTVSPSGFRIEEVQAYVEDLILGTFANPPVTGDRRGLVDIAGDRLLIVVPEDQVEAVIQAIDNVASQPDKPVYGQSPLTDTVQAPPAEGGDDRDELFEKLLESLERTQGQPDAPSQAQQAEGQRQEEPLPESRDAEAVFTPQVRLPAGVSPPSEVPTLPSEVPLDAVPDVLPEPSIQPPPEQHRLPSAAKTEPVSGGQQILELDLPEKLNIVDLFDLVGKYLNLDYMYDPVKVKGEVTLKLQGRVSVNDLYPLLESVLKFKGFAMTRKGNLVMIVPTAEALDIDPQLEVGNARAELGDVVTTRIFELNYIGTDSAKNLLDGMKLGTSITPIPETGTLIVTEYAYRMDRIAELLEIIDRPGEPKQFMFRQLKYTMAISLAPKVKDLADELGTVSVTVSAPTPSPTPSPRRPARRTTPSARQQTIAGEPQAGGVYLDADERTNRVLMIGQADQLEIVDSLIDALDVEQQDLRTLRLYEIQHVDAVEVLGKLQELAIVSDTGTTGYYADRADQAVPGTPQPRTARTRQRTARTPAAAAGQVAEVAEEGPIEEPQVVVIESTNSLLVNATAEQHARIAMIIGYVDSETLKEAIPYEIYSLENQSPDHLAEVLNKLVQEVVQDKEGKVERVIKKEEDIVIVPDPNTFSLIVYANKKNQEWIRKMVSSLDKRRPQVLIDVSLVEITQDKDFQYDLNIITNAKDLVTNNLSLTTGLITAATGNELEGAWNMGSDGTVRGFLADDKFQAILAAIDSKDYGRVLARPRVLVNDNSKGVINTTDKTYVQESTTSYTEQGIPITTTNFVPYEAKIELSITPHISEGDLLRLEVDMLREDFTPKTSAPPDYKTSNITTVVTVPDGTTIILGGLTKLNQSKGGNKIPLLGDIPIVGGLFRAVANSSDDSRLYIFVKANILRPDTRESTQGLAQLRQISTENRQAFERAEEKFQEHRSLPGLKPDAMDPLRVLDDL